MPASGSSLAKTQAWFFSQLQPHARRTRGPVRKVGALSNRERVDIYADMYLARLEEALAAEFPRLRTALGERAFHRLGEGYFARHPSRRPTIQHVGAKLIAYLGRHPVRGFAFARDLARLDEGASQVYLAPGLGDDPLLSAEDLKGLPPAAWVRLRFTLTPTLRFLRLAWSFSSEYPDSGRKPSRRPSRKPSTVRLWRRGLDSFEAVVSPEELRALKAALAGKTFGEVCLAVGSAERAANLLATWLQQGLLLKPLSARR